MTSFQRYNINYLQIQQEDMSILSILLITIFAILFTIFYLVYYKPKRQMARYKRIMEGLGYKVYVFPVTFLPFIFVDELKQAKEKGDPAYFNKTQLRNYDVTLFNIFNKVGVFFSNVDLQKDFFAANKIDVYHKMTYIFGGMTDLIGQGLIFSQGDIWRRKRKIFSKLFTHQLIVSNIPVICSIVDKTLNQFEEKNKTQNGQYAYNVKKIGEQMFSSVTLKSFMGVDLDEVKIKDERLPLFYINLLNLVGKHASSLLVLLFGKYAYFYGMTKELKQINEDFKLYHAACMEMISSKRQDITQRIEKQGNKFKPNTVLESLMLQIKRNQEQDAAIGIPHADNFSDRELYEQLSNFLVAGTDTTSAVYQMMFLYLAQNPQVEKKVRALVDTVIKTDQDITCENLKKLEYIEWMMNQAMRMATPLPSLVPRISTQDHMLGDIPITKGTIVVNNMLSIHYSQKYFKQPFAFRPERWQSQYKQLPQFAMPVFSGGPRNCLGKHLAIMQAKIATVKLLKRYKQIKWAGSQVIMKRDLMYEAQEPSNIVTFVK